MLILPQTLAMVLGAFASMFSKRVFAQVKRLIVGAILVPGIRTVTSVLRVMGTRDDRHFQNYHRVLSRAQWPALHGGRILLQPSSRHPLLWCGVNSTLSIKHPLDPPPTRHGALKVVINA